MAQLTAKLFRDYFGGSWSGKISKDGEFQREIVFDWPVAFGKFSAFGTEAGLMVPQGFGALDNTRQITISGWRGDVRSWHTYWYNEFGGYGNLEWTSLEVVDGVTIIYGSLHECKQESDDPTDHIATCEMYDLQNFKYTLCSFKKGLTEIVAKRIRTAKELNDLQKKQVAPLKNFAEIAKNIKEKK